MRYLKQTVYQISYLLNKKFDSLIFEIFDVIYDINANLDMRFTKKKKNNKK